MSYLGIPPFGRTSRTVTEVAATSGQTTFYPTGGYTVGYIDVVLNGIQLNSTDYTATDGLAVVLLSPAAVNDELHFTNYTVNVVEIDTSILAPVAVSGNYTDLTNKPSIPSVAGLASETYVNTQISNLIDGAPSALNTLKEISDQLATDQSAVAAITTTLAGKANTSSLSAVATGGRFVDLNSKPTTLNGYGITDAQPLDADLTAIAGLTGTTGLLQKTAANTWTLDTNTYLTGITLGQVTGALGFTPYNSTNPSGYISSITSGNVTTALGYTPYNSTNPSGYISSITSSNVTTALGYTPENPANRGTANGYATLDGSGLVPSTQLPSYVDDVLEYANLASFPATGTSGKIFVALDTNKTYRWSGSAYVYITSGAVDSVAGKTGIVSLVSSDVGLGNVENKSSATIRSEISSANVTGALGFTPYNSTNPSGYITGITSSNVTTALGYTPYNSSNPNGYITSSGSISGNAATATTASNLSGLTLNSSSAAINPDNVTQNQIGYNTNISLFGQTDGGLYSSAYGSNWIHQIYGDFRSGQIAIRGKNSGTWQAWRSVLDSSNYTSYAPSLTGSGASGTWGINVTGYSNYVNKVEAYQWSNSTLPSGYNSGIETSFVSSAQGFPQYGVVLSVMGRSPSDPGGNFQLYMGHGTDYGGLGLRVRSVNQANNAWTSWKILLDETNYTGYALPTSSSATNSVDIRSPIFYDSNNTGYYIDPASTSRLVSTIIGGHGGNAYDTVTSGRLYLGTNADNSYSIYTHLESVNGNYTKLTLDWHTGIKIGAAKLYGGTRFYNNSINSGGAQIFSVGDGDDNVRALYGFYTPISYDSNDTGYYVNPNGSSVLDSVTVNSITGYVNGLSGSGNNISGMGTASTWDARPGGIYDRYAINWHTGISLSGYPSYGGVRLYSAGYPTLNSSTLRLEASSGVYTYGQFTNDNRVDAPIFYDYNNTGYYVDPASTTNLNTVNVNALNIGGVAVTAGGGGGDAFSAF
jgi:hypothetical protein